MTIGELIDDFLRQKRLAFVGVSRNPKDFSRRLLDELRQRGYSVMGVNPNINKVADEPFFERVQDVVPPVDGALLMTSPDVTDQVVRDCAEAGISRIWMHPGVGKGAVSQAAVDFCNERGIRVIPGYCPYMFLPKTGLVHRVHRFLKKLTRQ
jgi:predicted CoA-binding protein